MTKLIVYILLGLSVSMCNAETTNNHVINRASVEILQGCYANDRTIVTDGTINEYIFQLLPMATITHNDSSLTNIKYKSKMSLFFITVNSVEDLRNKLVTFKYSPWWNVMATFFLLDRSNKYCENARDILKEAWAMNVVKSLFLCENLQGLPMIYSYNPYTNRAPKPWKKIEWIKSHEPWTLYNRDFNDGNMCDNLNYDRTKYLDGYEVRIVVSQPGNNDDWVPGREHDSRLNDVIPNHDYNETVIEMLPKLDGRFANALKIGLNATIVINFAALTYYTPEPEGVFKRLQNASSDYAVCILSYATIYNFTASYPIMWTGVSIATQHRGYYTPLEKIANYYGLWVPIATLLILTITFFVFMLVVKKEKLSFSTFECLRLIVNTSLHTRMNTLTLRIYFTGIFLYFLIIQTSFQGNLSSFLTKEQRRRNVESLDDLNDSRYKIVYVIASGRKFIEDTLLEKVKIPQHPLCASEVANDKSVVCIAESMTLIKARPKYKIHIAEKEVGPMAYVHATREDWPLFDRVNIVLIRIAQSGLSGLWKKNMIEKEEIQQKIFSERSIVLVRPINLEMLIFAFEILAIGLTTATICILLEILVGRLAMIRRNW